MERRADLLDSSLPCSSYGEESVGEKLRREAELIVRGGIGGFAKSACEAVSAEHIGETATTTGCGLLVGASLAYLSKGRSLFRTGAQVFGATATVSFAGDVLLHARTLSDTVADNWKSDANWNRNLQVSEKTLGKFAFDTALMTAAGVAGAAIQPKLSSLFKRSDHAIPAAQGGAVEGLAQRDPAHPLGFAPDPAAFEVLPTMRPGQNTTIDVYMADSAIGQLASRYKNSIVQVEVAQSSGFLQGTGFVVGADGTIATCFHVVNPGGGIGSACKIKVDGKIMNAKIRNLDEANDLALLKLEGLLPEPLLPLPIAKNSAKLKADAELITLGYGGSNVPVASPGKVTDATFKFSQIPPQVGGAPDSTFIAIFGRTTTGASGGPVFNAATGEVVGVHSAGNHRDAAYARPVEVLHRLMKKPPGYVARLLSGS